MCLVLGWAKDVDEKAIRHPPTGASFSSAGDNLLMPSVQLILRWRHEVMGLWEQELYEPLLPNCFAFSGGNRPLPILQ